MLIVCRVWACKWEISREVLTCRKGKNRGGERSGGGGATSQAETRAQERSQSRNCPARPHNSTQPISMVLVVSGATPFTNHSERSRGQSAHAEDGSRPRGPPARPEPTPVAPTRCYHPSQSAPRLQLVLSRSGVVGVVAGTLRLPRWCRGTCWMGAITGTYSTVAAAHRQLRPSVNCLTSGLSYHLYASNFVTGQRGVWLFSRLLLTPRMGSPSPGTLYLASPKPMILSRW